MQMRSWKTALVALVTFSIATATFVPLVWQVRSAGPVEAKGTTPEAEAGFNRHESSGFFVGVGDFDDQALTSVPYGPDDAVDLAYMFSMDRRLPFLPPQRVVIALSGSPKKPESRKRLEELKAAGARQVTATAREILSQVQHQAGITGPAGIFVLSIATHGFMHQGNEYILGKSSIFRDPHTSLQTAKLFDIIARSAARRSLIFVDACRDRSLTGIRSTSGSTAPDLARKMKNVAGQVVFYAASAGNYAYDDNVNRNGVFTKAVLDGLGCNATPSDRFVTVGALHRYAEAQVKRWIRDNQKPPVDTAIQVRIDGRAETMPLSQCSWPPGPERLSVAFEDKRLNVFSKERKKLKELSFESPILHAGVADVDADGVQEIIVARQDRLEVFDKDFKLLWTCNVPGIRTFVTGDLSRKYSEQVVALSDSEVTVVGRDGQILRTFGEMPGLRHLEIHQQSPRYDYRIIAASATSLFLMRPGAARIEWERVTAPGDVIVKLESVARDKDLDRRDIAVTTKRGTSYFDVGGNPARRPPPYEWSDPKSKRRRQRLSSR